MKISQQQSDALRIVVFIATVMVVFRHGVNLHHYYAGGHQWIPADDMNIFIQRFISHFTNGAVPLFFVISGFLFFFGLSEFYAIKSKLLRRIHSLLIPFEAWNFLFLILWSCLYHTPQFHEQMIQSYGFSWNLPWFLSRLSLQPIVGQFWYIRTLMIFCCLSPVLLMFFRYRIIALSVLIMLSTNWVCIDTSVFSSEGLLFFYTGGFISTWHLQNNKFSATWFCWYIPIVVLGILAQIYFWKIPFDVCKLTILATVYFVVQGSMLITQTKLGALFVHMNRYSFFIFALHSVLVAGTSLIFSRLFPHTALYSLFSYFLCVSIAIAGSIVIAVMTHRFLPRCYEILSGGRG